MRKRLKWHRNLVFTGPRSDRERLNALVETLPATWCSDPDDPPIGCAPYSQYFERLPTDTDPAYRFELLSESCTYSYLLDRIEHKDGTAIADRDEWNHLAEMFEAEVVAPAAKITPALSYRFAPVFQAPKDWYGSEACASLRKRLAGNTCPCPTGCRRRPWLGRRSSNASSQSFWTTPCRTRCAAG